MSSIWFTSDTHFGHLKVAAERGFATIEEHDETLLGNITSRVRRGDQLRILGDIAMRETTALDMLARIPCEVHVILGNHDAPHPRHRDAHRHMRRWMDVVTSVASAGRMRIHGTEVLLSHYPYSGDHTSEDRDTQWRLRDEGRWLLHGHTHSRVRVSGRQIHVGVDTWGRPVHADEIAEIIKGAS